MRVAPFILAAVLALPVSALAEEAVFPLQEDAFLALLAARFDAADADKNGQIDASEAAAAFAFRPLDVSNDVSNACLNKGYDTETHFNPPPYPGAPVVAMTKKEYLGIWKVRFEKIDADHDTTLTAAEKTAFDAQELDYCTKNPLPLMDDIAGNDSLAFEQKRELIRSRNQDLQLALTPMMKDIAEDGTLNLKQKLGRIHARVLIMRKLTAPPAAPAK